MRDLQTATPPLRYELVVKDVPLIELSWEYACGIPGIPAAFAIPPAPPNPGYRKRRADLL
jgi:hypothetical protein